jgi:RNase P/RNase MRP subunit POP5
VRKLRHPETRNRRSYRHGQLLSAQLVGRNAQTDIPQSISGVWGMWDSADLLGEGLMKPDRAWLFEIVEFARQGNAQARRALMLILETESNKVILTTLITRGRELAKSKPAQARRRC